MKGSYSVTTSRLYLRTILREDTPLLARWRSEPENYRYFCNHHTLTMEEHLSWFDNQYSNDENRCDWLCIEKSWSKPSGFSD